MADPSGMTHAELVAEVLRLRAERAAPTRGLDLPPGVDPLAPDQLAQFDQLLDAVVVTDLGWRIRFWNAAAAAFYGWSRTEALGRSAGEVLGGTECASALAAIMAAGQWRGELTQQHRDGRPLAVEAVVQVIRDQAGAPRGLLAINRDIGTRRRLEAEQAELRAQAAAAQQAKDEALALIDAIIARSPIGFGFLDPNLRFRRINQTLADLNRRTPAEHLGHTLGELIPPLAERVEPVLRQVLSTGQPVLDIEMPVPPLSSEEAHQIWLASYYPVRLAPDRIAGIGVVVMDISRLKRAEAALRASEQAAAAHAALVDTIIANAPIGIALLDRELRYRQINAELATLNRRTAAEHLGRTVREMFPREGLQLERILQQVIATGQPIRNLELSGERPVEPGHEQTWLASYYPVRDGKEAIIGVGVIVAEITPQRQAAQLIDQHRRELEVIVETFEEGVLATYPNGTIAFLNSASRRLRGLPPLAQPPTWEDLLALSPFVILDADGKALAREQLPIARALRGEHFVGAEHCLIHTGSQERIWLSYNGNAVYDEHGALALAVVTSHDITGRKSDEATLRAHAEALSRTNAELARALRLKDEFLAMMSHELRTPLSAVLGITEALGEEIYGPITVRQRRALDTMLRSGQHLLALISDILELAVIEAGTSALAPAHVEVIGLCRRVTQLVEASARQKGVRLLVTIQGEVGGLRADERRLTQILVSLLDNAVKFTPAGGAVGLEVAPNPAQDQICFVVWDTGIGIADSDLMRLFQPFTQIDGRLSREYGGIGIGLSLVRRLVELHGGSIGLESAPGTGSRFTVRLPWGDEDQLAAPGPAAPAHTPTPPLWGRTLRVVIADDHEPTLSLYAELLVQRGCQVVTARTGSEAIGQIRDRAPDVVVLDIQMPGMDGLETVRTLRADQAVSHVPIIALTALAMPGDRERCLAAGVSAYLSKPVSLRSLIETITAVLPPEA